MDISLKHEDYCFLKQLKENSLEECVEAELSLPEYMPEILRIIKAVAEPKIISCKLIGERVTVDGACELRMIYTAEDGCVYSFSQTRQFTRHCENEDFLNATDVNAIADISYVNCRATGTKRADIKSGVRIKINVCLCEKEDIVCIENEGVQQKKMQINASSLGCRKTRQFSMSDTVTLSEPSAFILYQNACAVLSEIKKISNKLMLRGETIVTIVYVNAENKALCEKVIHSIPINQIIEIEGFEERFDGNVTLRVNSLDIIPKGEQNGFTTAFDLSVGVDAVVTMWDECDLSLITDAYCINSGLDLKKSPFCFYKLQQELKQTHILNESFSVAGEGVSAILCAMGEVSSTKCTAGDSDISVDASVSLSFVIRDNENSIVCVNKAFDFSHKVQVEGVTGKLVCEPEVKIISIKAMPKASNTIDFSAEILINGMIFSEMCCDVVVDITENENVVSRKKSALTVYFPQCENESLWGIARKYNTTVEAIADENELKGDTTEKLKILFIPCA